MLKSLLYYIITSFFLIFEYRNKNITFKTFTIMKTLNKLTGTNDLTTNLIALTGLTLVSILIISFTILAITNGINEF